ncbi:MAG: sugar-binding domain-containing protein [Terriglobia bacterium]
MRTRACRVASLAILLFSIGRQVLKAQQPNSNALWQPYYVDPRAGEQHLSLNGDWGLGYRDTAIATAGDLDQQKWIRAEVPTSAQWALYQAGVLPYPYAHLNTRKYAWVPDKVWYYRRQFELPAGAKDDYIFLCFDGVGYYSKIWLNGTLIGRHEGMFGGPHVEVSRWLHFGQSNQIIVEVKGGSYGVQDWNPDETGKVILPWGSAGGTKYVTSSSGIDPREIEPLGIWQGVRLEMTPKVHLARPFLVTKKATKAEAWLWLKVEVLADTTAVGTELHPWKGAQLTTIPDSSKAKAVEPELSLQIELTDKSTSLTVLKRRWPLKVYEGRNWVSRQLAVFSPRLWWPNGMGNPSLYRARLTLLQRDKAIDRIEFDYGIRTIERVPTPGPQTQDRWTDWQFVVNGRPLFVKGINWAWPLDVLLHLPAEKYRWLLEAAHGGNVQLIRVWGGGNPETDEFYQLCDRLGIMVWEDFPVGNEDTPGWPQDVWESQVLQTIFRLRNHSSLAVWCGGNEFNPYDTGNTATIGIIERSVRDFDGTRMFLRTTPDPGDAHIYIDMDPTWYGHLYRWVPFISETGIYNMPEPESLLEVVDPQELKGSFQDIFSKGYPDRHPEFIHHMLEYQGQEPRTLLSRASQMDDLSKVDLSGFSSATQMAAAEFTQILSDLTQANYPVTTGLMPWSLTVPWPIEFFMFIDGLDQPTSSYYTLKRTYEPTHIVVRLPALVWAKGEKIPISISVVHAPPTGLAALTVSVDILDPQFHPVWNEKRQMDVQPGPSAKGLEMGEFTIPDSLEDKFFFVVAEVKQADGSLVSRSVYWPRCLKLMSDPDFRAKYRGSPQPSLNFEHGPWLRPQVAAVRTSLDLMVISRKDISDSESAVRVRVRNTGASPAFDAHVDIAGTKRAFYGTDNDLWLMPGEERTMDFTVLWRDPAAHAGALVTAGAWNAELRQVPMPAAR